MIMRMPFFRKPKSNEGAKNRKEMLPAPSVTKHGDHSIVCLGNSTLLRILHRFRSTVYAQRKVFDVCPIREARTINFPDEDLQDLEKFSEVQLGTKAHIEVIGYSALDLFSVFPRRRLIAWNLNGGSCMVGGKRTFGGAYISGSAIVIPEQLFKRQTNFKEYLHARKDILSELKSDGVKKFKERYNISKGGFDVEDWRLTKGFPFITNDRWSEYASRELFPYLKAAANGTNFVIRDEKEVTIIREPKPFPDLYARLARLKAIESFCVPTHHGVLVAAPCRFLVSLVWFILSLAVGIWAAMHKRNDWLEGIESFFTMTTIIALTLPAIVSLLVREPEVIRNAVLGKKTLTSDQQVATWFSLTEKDYAAASIFLNGTFLVSEARGRYLSGKANRALSGNGYLVSSKVLQGHLHPLRQNGKTKFYVGDFPESQHLASSPGPPKRYRQRHRLSYRQNSRYKIFFSVIFRGNGIPFRTNSMAPSPDVSGNVMRLPFFSHLYQTNIRLVLSFASLCDLARCREDLTSLRRVAVAHTVGSYSCSKLL